MLEKIAVMPHGDEVLVPEDDATRNLKKLMKEIGKNMAGEDEYVIITPHNIRIDDHIGVILTEHAYGFWKYRKVRFGGLYKCDRTLAMEIYQRGKEARIPVAGINFGALEGKLSRIQLDWGTLIPLYFLPKKHIVILTPARKIKREKLVRFGELLGNILSSYPRNIALIVSADHAHTHLKEGPYGFAPEARKYDEYVMKALKSGNLSPLLSLEEEFIEKAKPDSYWQLLILYGFLKHREYRVEKCVYACPTYFGMSACLITSRNCK